ncbi:hypothetical protein GGF31_003332 [Allomyces arbusculus]|nr:hypothetical protein GGF31_003332 [Allomyces arbusculus]
MKHAAVAQVWPPRPKSLARQVSAISGEVAAVPANSPETMLILAKLTELGKKVEGMGKEVESMGKKVESINKKVESMDKEVECVLENVSELREDVENAQAGIDANFVLL